MTSIVTEACADLFQIKIPLPDKFLKYLNAYVVRSPERSLIIDTGFDTREGYEAMTRGLAHIGVSPDASDIFITHCHADHFAMVPRLIRPGTRIFFNSPEIPFLENWQGLKTIAQRAFANGFPPVNTKKAAGAFPQLDFDLGWLADVEVMSQGSVLAYGAYRLSCIETPGHSPGHICLYDADHKLLVSGDHVLMDISPNIQCVGEEDNPLAHYLTSLEKIQRLDVEIVLPAHRRAFSRLAERIRELTGHHMSRLDELRRVMENVPVTAYEVAQKMRWDIRADNWEAFPAAQKWFAMGEALSHIRFLEVLGEVRRSQSRGVTCYTRI